MSRFLSGQLVVSRPQLEALLEELEYASHPELASLREQAEELLELVHQMDRDMDTQLLEVEARESDPLEQLWRMS